MTMTLIHKKIKTGKIKDRPRSLFDPQNYAYGSQENRNAKFVL